MNSPEKKKNLRDRMSKRMSVQGLLHISKSNSTNEVTKQLKKHANSGSALAKQHPDEDFVPVWTSAQGANEEQPPAEDTNKIQEDVISQEELAKEEQELEFLMARLQEYQFKSSNTHDSSFTDITQSQVEIDLKNQLKLLEVANIHDLMSCGDNLRELQHLLLEIAGQVDEVTEWMGIYSHQLGYLRRYVDQIRADTANLEVLTDNRGSLLTLTTNIIEALEVTEERTNALLKTDLSTESGREQALWAADWITAVMMAKPMKQPPPTASGKSKKSSTSSLGSTVSSSGSSDGSTSKKKKSRKIRKSSSNMNLSKSSGSERKKKRRIIEPLIPFELNDLLAVKEQRKEIAALRTKFARRLLDHVLEVMSESVLDLEKQKSSNPNLLSRGEKVLIEGLSRQGVHKSLSPYQPLVQWLCTQCEKGFAQELSAKFVRYGKEQYGRLGSHFVMRVRVHSMRELGKENRYLMLKPPNYEINTQGLKKDMTKAEIKECMKDWKNRIEVKAIDSRVPFNIIIIFAIDAFAIAVENEVKFCNWFLGPRQGDSVASMSLNGVLEHIIDLAKEADLVDHFYSVAAMSEAKMHELRLIDEYHDKMEDLKTKSPEDMPEGRIGGYAVDPLSILFARIEEASRKNLSLFVDDIVSSSSAEEVKATNGVLPHMHQFPIFVQHLEQYTNPLTGEISAPIFTVMMTALFYTISHIIDSEVRLGVFAKIENLRYFIDEIPKLGVRSLRNHVTQAKKLYSDALNELAEILARKYLKGLYSYFKELEGLLRLQPASEIQFEDAFSNSSFAKLCAKYNLQTMQKLCEKMYKITSSSLPSAIIRDVWDATKTRLIGFYRKYEDLTALVYTNKKLPISSVEFGAILSDAMI